mmetsp:Transcript_19994/g.39278  ORF Transcript_19994/g.39278 Transcript_19994/m.39278 type:complete len:81 (+) Transcript_19994:1682-1924(+)
MNSVALRNGPRSLVKKAKKLLASTKSSAAVVLHSLFCQIKCVHKPYYRWLIEDFKKNNKLQEAHESMAHSFGHPWICLDR